MADLQSVALPLQHAAPSSTSGATPARLTDPPTGTPDNGCEPVREMDADLARIIEVWATLPPPIRRAMLALISAGTGQ
jgi:hypothetical protein